MKKGFTLIELLTTIALIGVVAAASLTILNPVTQLQKARDSRRKSDLLQIQSAFELYRSDQGAYPSSLGCGTGLIVGGTTYLKAIPCDPKNSGQLIYYYSVGSPPSTYSLTACLENAADPKKDSTTHASCAAGAYKSYTVTNP